MQEGSFGTIARTETREWTREWGAFAKKTLIALANTFGGRLYVGADGTKGGSGVEDFDKTVQQVLEFCRQEVEPDMSLLVRVVPQRMNKKTLAVIFVEPGMDRPYAFRDRNWLDGGVFVRVGAATVQAVRADIMRMVQEVLPWEERISRFQNLTFNEAEAIDENCCCFFDSATSRDRGVTDEVGRYTNLAFLLSDQNPHEVVVNRFDRLKEGVPISRKFKGSLIRQRCEIFRWLEDVSASVACYGSNGWSSASLREALANSLVQHDYGGDCRMLALVNVYSDRLVFQTVSSLPFDVTSEDVFCNGFSFCRNPRLAAVFANQGWTTGIGSFSVIFTDYARSLQKPTCSTTGRLFQLTLPRRIQPESTLQDRLVALLRETPGQGRRSLEKAVGMSRASVITELKKLLDAGRVERRGTARATRYYLRTGE